MHKSSIQKIILKAKQMSASSPLSYDDVYDISVDSYNELAREGFEDESIWKLMHKRILWKMSKRVRYLTADKRKEPPSVPYRPDMDTEQKDAVSSPRASVDYLIITELMDEILTDTEKTLLHMVADGAPKKDIERELNMTERGVRTVIARAQLKMQKALDPNNEGYSIGSMD